MVTEMQQFEAPKQTPLDFYLWGWIKSEIYKRNVDRRDELLARILDVAACIKTSEYQLRRTTRELQSALSLTVGFMDIYCEL